MASAQSRAIWAASSVRRSGSEVIAVTGRAVVLVVLLVIPGLVVAAVSAGFALQDWGQLVEAYAQFRAVAASEAPLRELYAANAVQEMHRVNLFADVVWALQGAVLFGLGVCGLCLLPMARAH